MTSNPQPSFLKVFSLILILVLSFFLSEAQVSYTGGTYSQNFNGLPASGGPFAYSGAGPFFLSTAPVSAAGMPGWQIARIAGTGNAQITVNAGTGTAGGNYSYGTGTNSDRALGSIASGTNVPAQGVIITNNVGYTLNEITVNYTGEEWRNGGNNNPDTLVFQYGVGATDILTGTFTTVNNLSFISPVFSSTASSLDGNNALNKTAKSFTITGLTWNNGQNIVLRWIDANSVGSDNGISIDDFSFSATGTPPAPVTQDFNITFPSVLPNALTASWTTGDGSSRIAIINTVNSFTDPVNGSNPSANTVYSGSGEQVVFNGAGSSVSITGLLPSAQYYVRVYAYNGSGIYTSYHTGTATDNPKDQTTQAAATPLISVTGALANFGDVLAGNSSLEQSYSVSGTNLADDILITAPSGFEISLSSGTGFTNSFTLPQSGGTVSATTVYVRFTPASLGGISGNITHSSNTATTVNQPVAGTGVEPVISINASSFNFNSVFVGSSSSNSTYIVSGSNLISDILITTTPDFQISTNAVSGFGSSITLNASGLGSPGGGSVPATTIYARFSPLAPGVQNASIDHTSTNATSQSISLTGTGVTPPVFTELVVPQYMGSKSASGTNNSRTPIAICIQLDNLQPSTAYDVKLGFGLTSDAASSYGAGNFWNGSSFNATPNILSAFVTDAAGSSGPVWFYMQPTGNATRFDAGQVHNIRFGYAVSGNSMPSSPQFVGSKTITCLDIPATARTSGVTTDDGAFLHVQATSCHSGKYILIYDNVSGTGDPVYSYQARNGFAINTSQSDLPSIINSIFSQSGSSVDGDYAAVIPIGANNPNGIRRIEARNADNTVFRATTDADGVWNSGANTTNNTRRSVTTITPSDGLNSVSGFLSGDAIICSGIATNLTFTFSGNAPFTYIYSDGTNNFGPFVSLTSTDVRSVSPTSSTLYTLLTVDDAQCSGMASGTAFVFVLSAPPSTSVTVPINNLPPTACNGTTVSISVPFVTGATQYTWDAPAGSYFNGNPLNISPYVTSTPSVSLTFGNPTGSGYYIGVQAGNACGNSNRKSQWVRGVVSTPVLSGPSTICASSTNTYSINPVTGALNYTWSGPSGSTIDGNPSPFTTANTSVSLITPSGFSNGSVCVTANTSCYSTPAKCIAVTKMPAQPGILSGVFTVCPNTSQVYSVPSAGAGGSYNWSLPLNATGFSNTNSINVNFDPLFTGGNISVTYTNACGETSPVRLKSISIGSPSTPASITGITNGICGQIVTYSCPSQLGTSSFNWTLSGGATGSSTTNSISVTFPSAGFTTGTVSVSASNACGTSPSRSITVKGAPNTPGVIVPSPPVWCNGTSGISFNSDISGVTGSYLLNWNWTPAAAASLFSGQGTNTLILDWNTGNAMINLTASNGCGSATRSYSAVVSCREANTNTNTEPENSFVVFPNPASEIIYLKLAATAARPVVVTITDVAGRMVLKQDIISTDNERVSLNVSSLNAGAYLVEVIAAERVFNSKLVVE